MLNLYEIDATGQTGDVYRSPVVGLPHFAYYPARHIQQMDGTGGRLAFDREGAVRYGVRVYPHGMDLS
jgi:hypothetical protein